MFDTYKEQIQSAQKLLTTKWGLCTPLLAANPLTLLKEFQVKFQHVYVFEKAGPERPNTLNFIMP